MSYKNSEQLAIDQFIEKAYLDYSMYVILDRALPHIGDGLKPVQRRIIYAMSELGLSALSKHKKSARTVGDVLGKYHPHGDSACYEAMVLMAQSFSYRYPLIDGQGNWGSIDDPKSFAAMRYTESKLTQYAQLLLRELSHNSIEWQPNFDGSLKEPVTLPAILPNILLNGASGIAVGMSTDIPPHHIGGVVDACLAVIDDNEVTNDQLVDLLEGPDYPTYGELITPKKDLYQLYETGQGSLKLRSVYVIEDKKIVITSLPYQVSSAKVTEQRAQQMQSKKLPMIEDLRDDSTEDQPVRLVLIPRSNRIDLDQVMQHLYATTDLEKNYRVNLNMIGINGKPEVKSLKTILTEWLTYRQSVVVKRFNVRLEIIYKRLHLLDGLFIAYLNLDEVIRIIRQEDEPKPVLIKRFSLTDEQADYILETKLRQLARLEEMKLQSERDKLNEEREKLEHYLANPKALKKFIRDEVKKAGKDFADQRKTILIERDAAKAIREADLMPTESVTVVLSKMGWVRLAKGQQIDPKELNYKTGDAYQAHAFGRSNQEAVFLTKEGRSFSLSAYSLPSARGFGEPLSGKLAVSNHICEYVLLDKNDSDYLFVNHLGYGFISEYENLITRAKAGKAFISLSGKKLLPPVRISQDINYLLFVSSDAYFLLLPISEIPRLPRGKGNKLIQLPKKMVDLGGQLDTVIPLVGDELLAFSIGRKKEKLDKDAWIQWLGERAKRGRKVPKGLENFKRIEVIHKN